MVASKNNIRITLRGCGITIAKGTIGTTLLNRLHVTAREFNAPLEQAIFDCEFFDSLRDAQVKSWRNFDNVFHTKGLADFSNSFIEVKKANKTILKAYLREILQENLLFPLYNVRTIVINPDNTNANSITIVENEIVMIDSYFLSDADFKIYDLAFTIRKIQIGQNNYSILHQLKYHNNILKSTGNDTLVTGCYAILESKLSSNIS